MMLMPRTAVRWCVPIVFRSSPRAWGIRLTKFALVAFDKSPFVVTVPIGAIVDLTDSNTVLVGAAHPQDWKGRGVDRTCPEAGYRERYCSQETHSRFCCSRRLHS